MNTIMNDNHLTSIAQLEKFLKATEGIITFNTETKGNKNKQLIYDWISKMITQLQYERQRKLGKTFIIEYIQKLTQLSRGQIKKSIKKKRKGKLVIRTQDKHIFPEKYTTSDIQRLIDIDNAHGRISGEATKKIMEREYSIYGKEKFENIRHISVSHLYRIRSNKLQYTSNVLTMGKTKATQRDIGVRKKPHHEGKPGHIRVDTVHQGDKDKEKGVYHINMVDEVTQWEIIGCVEGISEQFLTPLLETMMQQFPFKIIGFHSDNGSEFINHQVSKMLNKMMIDQTKSRSRRTNDNALVEGKNGSRIRKHMGYVYIQKKHASDINIFYREHMNIYLNFHRPCGFSTDTIDTRGKITKVYDIYMTPYEKLISLPDWEIYLKDTVTAGELENVMKAQSDNECALKLQKAKQILFKNFN